MTELNELIKNRRSIFPNQFNDKEVSVDFIKQLLENANWAPTHKKTEPWRFTVVRKKAKENLGTFLADTYTDITPDQKFSPFKYDKIKNACKWSSAIIIICMQRDPKERIPEWEEVAAVSMAVQNMWLTCAANDVGCYWSSPGLIKYIDDFLTLDEGEQCLGFLYLGHYDQKEEIPSKRKPIEAKTRWLES